MLNKITFNKDSYITVLNMDTCSWPSMRFIKKKTNEKGDTDSPLVPYYFIDKKLTWNIQIHYYKEEKKTIAQYLCSCFKQKYHVICKICTNIHVYVFQLTDEVFLVVCYKTMELFFHEILSFKPKTRWLFLYCLWKSRSIGSWEKRKRKCIPVCKFVCSDVAHIGNVSVMFYNRKPSVCTHTLCIS
jgi:hypothetical protein